MWDDASDHTPVIYMIGDINVTICGRRRITKTMLNNPRKNESAREYYEWRIPKIIESTKKAGKEEAQSLHDEFTEAILEPWQRISDSKPRRSKPHCNKKLENLKRKIYKARLVVKVHWMG